MSKQSQPTYPLNSWQFDTLADAYAAGPPPTYAIDGLFAHGTVNIVYGAPGSFKSMLLADAAVCLAAGRNWLHRDADHPGFAVTPSPVLWIDFDNGPGRTKRRFAALGRAYGLADDLGLRYVTMPEPWLDASDREQMAHLTQIIEQQKTKFVVIDNLSMVSGGIEENSSEMRQIMGAFRRLVRDTDAALVVIHHQRKSRSQSSGRLGESLRGHSSIEANVDLALLMERQGDTPCFTAQSTKVRGPDVPPFRGCFIYEHQPGTRNLRTARFKGAASPEERERRQIDEKLREVLSEGAHPKTDFIKDVAKALTGISREKVRTRVDEQIFSGGICQTRIQDGRSRTKFIHLCDDGLRLPSS